MNNGMYICNSERVSVKHLKVQIVWKGKSASRFDPVHLFIKVSQTYTTTSDTCTSKVMRLCTVMRHAVMETLRKSDADGKNLSFDWVPLRQFLVLIGQFSETNSFSDQIFGEEKRIGQQISVFILLWLFDC